MENTVIDSNSESDISDSWAVIDDSSLEWNNEISLGQKSHQYDFVKSTMPRRRPRSNSSKSELSDEDSIEVVAEDHTDDLSDEGAEVVQEKWTGTLKLESIEKICTGNCLPIQDLPQYRHTTQLKKINHKWRESNPILITILMMGILGGFCLGYLWGSHSYKSEDCTSNSNSIQATRALLTALENEIQFLHRQLRSTQSSLKSTVSKTVPKLNHIAKRDLHIKTKTTPFKVVDPGMCSITDFIGKSLALQDNSLKEYCLASDRPQDWTSGANNMTVNSVYTSSSSNINPVKNHVQVTTRLNRNTPNTPLYTYDAEQIDQTSQESSKTASFEPFNSFQHINTIEAEPNSDDIDIGMKTSGSTAGNEPIISYSEGISDPRPYTKLRTTVERIYTILSVRSINHEHQPVFPSQLELLSILPHNIFSLDLSKVHFTASVYDKMTSLSIQMHDITQQLFSDIDLSTNNFVQHIASKIKEIETLNKKQICNLKTILESSSDIAILDLDHEPIFKKCIQEKQNDNNDYPKNEYKHEVKNMLTESKDNCMVRDNSISDQKGLSDKIWKVKGSLELGHRNENLEHADTQDLNFEFGEAKEGKGREGRRGPQTGSDLNKKPPTEKKIILKNKSQLQESVGTPVLRETDTYSDKKVKSKIVNEAKHYKSGGKHSELHVKKKYEKSGTKKKLNNKEKEYYNESHGKNQKDSNKSGKWIVNNNKTSSNVSGEWTIQMAHGRAEQRRRDHQSDWVFERAKLRMSNRRKSVKESYWHNHRDRSSKFSRSGVFNNTVPLKEQTYKRWKEVKQHMKKDIWKPLIDSAKSVKKAFNKFNSKVRYHSRQER